MTSVGKPGFAYRASRPREEDRYNADAGWCLFTPLITDAREEISQIVLGLLKKQRGKLFIGGDLTREYPPSLRPWLAEGIRIGWIVNVPDGEVDQETACLSDRHVLKSNDHHVVALARVSGARVLVSCDGDLRADFRDRNLISQPPGKLFPFSADKARVRKFLRQRRLCARQAETSA